LNLPTPVEITADIFNYVCERYLKSASSVQIKKSLRKTIELLNVLRDEKEEVSYQITTTIPYDCSCQDKEVKQEDLPPVVSKMIDTFVESVQPLVASLKAEEPTRKRKPRCDIGKPRKSKTEVSINNEILENMGKEIVQKINAEFCESLQNTDLEEAAKMVGKPYALEIISEEDVIAEEMPLVASQD
jgi:hypothetical protein